jgi:hypothetical protein
MLVKLEEVNVLEERGFRGDGVVGTMRAGKSRPVTEGVMFHIGFRIPSHATIEIRACDVANGGGHSHTASHSILVICEMG